MALVAGCSSSVAGQPSASGGGSGSSVSGGSGKERLSPPLEQPVLDLKPFETKPCELLKPEQVASLTKPDPPKSGNDALGPNCTWHGSDAIRDTTVSVSLNVSTGEGLEGAYRRRSKFAQFDEFRVAGYPGVHANESEKAEGMGNCGSMVGVSDSTALFFIVHVKKGNPDYSTSCRVNEKVAEMVIQNLKAAK
ncbi:DUF3558 domain-containing protein [Streptoalloteichus tenebrarius]|uniref:DUF3558 domain-containing protein n=1 Tax=Streptoalloteichus tenebrarius (strain ATCC 17920 / DSM 40477 / JCM 4838 / CBS 697.72 / NBRC 16177 / NCIMB 11028 / NRRL B-12390 / A12253. 1 / ISP 5477) TaxID=1933 RepID=UPI0035EC208C